MKQNLFKKIWDEFVYGGHFLALGDALALYALGMILGINVTWDFLLVIYLVVFASNLFNRVKEIEIDVKTNPERTKITNRYIKLYGFVMLTMYSFAGWLIISFSSFKALIFIFIPVILALLYTTLFKPLTKKIIGFKSFVAAFFYALLIFFLVFYYYNPVTLGVFLVFIFYYLRIFISNAFCDFKDINGDKAIGLKTLAVQFGVKKSVKLLNYLNYISALPILTAVYYNLIPLYSLAILFTIIFFHFTFRFYNKKENELLFNVIVDGEFMFWVPLLILLKLVV